MLYRILFKRQDMIALKAWLFTLGCVVALAIALHIG